MSEFVGCAVCNRVLLVEHGPICDDCRREGHEVVDVTNASDDKPEHVIVPPKGGSEKEAE